MMDMKINVGGSPVRLFYGSTSDDPNALVVTFTQQDNNQTKFNVQSNPTDIPPNMARVIVGCVHEQLIRMAHDIPSPLYIVVEK